MTLEDVIEYILGDEIQDETDTAAVTGVTSKATRGLDGSRHGLDGSRHGGLDASGHGGSNHAYLRYQRAVSDFGRLRLLDRTLRDEKLDAGEARVGDEEQELVLCGWFCRGWCDVMDGIVSSPPLSDLSRVCDE